MGKKQDSSSTKISKQEENKQLNNLIKVLRPKVYITDSSSFKNLVQELTGFDEKVGRIPPPPNLPIPCREIESPPVVEVQDGFAFPESSFEFSLDSGSGSSTRQEMEFSEYREIESWLLEIDQFQNYDMYAPLGHQEVCEYDYDFSGLV